MKNLIIILIMLVGFQANAQQTIAEYDDYFSYDSVEVVSAHNKDGYSTILYHQLRWYMLNDSVCSIVIDGLYSGTFTLCRTDDDSAAIFTPNSTTQINIDNDIVIDKVVLYRSREAFFIYTKDFSNAFFMYERR